MKRTATALTLMLGAAMLAGPAAIWHAPAASAAEAAKKGEKKVQDTPLQKQMEVIETAMKDLRKTLRKAEENDASLKSIADLKKASTACLDLIPAMAATVPEAQRPTFVENYKKVMGEFIASVEKLEAAVKAGENDKAVEIHKTLREMEDPAHEKFTKS